MKYLISIIGIFCSVLIFMKLLSMLNAGNTLMNIAGLIGIFLLGFVIGKTKLFTKFKK